MEELETKVEITEQDIAKYLESDVGKKILQKRLDTHFSKSLETWKENNLEKIVSEELSKKMPTETEEQKQLKELTLKLTKMEQEKNRESLKNKALTLATKKGLPTDLVDYFIGADESQTEANLEKLETVFTQSLSQAIEGKLKDSGRKPEPSKNLSEIEKLEQEHANAKTIKEKIAIKQKLHKLKGD